MPPPRSASAVLVALILAGACLLGADFSRPDLATFALGKTTEAEIRQRFGEPSGQATVQVGDKSVTTLHYAHAEARSTLVPARALVLAFHDGRLVGFSYTSSFTADETTFDEAAARRIKRGETTRAEVLALVGKPTGQFIYPSPQVKTPGQRADLYTYTRTDRVPSGGTLEVTTKVLVITFDDRDVVAETNLTITATSKALQ